MVLIAPKTTHSRIANKHRKHQAFHTGTDRRKTWCFNRQNEGLRADTMYSFGRQDTA